MNFTKTINIYIKFKKIFNNLKIIAEKKSRINFYLIIVALLYRDNF